MIHPKKIWIFCFLFLILAQCSYTKRYKNVDSRITGNSQAVDSLTIQIKSAQEQIEKFRVLFDKKVQLIDANIGTSKSLRAKIRGLENSVNALESKLQQQDAAIVEITEEPDDTKVVSSVKEYPVLENPTPEKIYQRAREYYKDGKYQESIGGFSQIIHDYPENDLAQNSQYWIGECYYCLEQYETAMYSFDKVISNYSFTDKTVDAKLKIALCLIGMKEYQGALTQLKEIRETHPGYHNILLVDEKIDLLENQ